MRDVVAGLDRHVVHREPNGVECDFCKARISNPRCPPESLRSAVQHMGWSHVDGKDRCPKCTIRDLN